MRMITSEAFDGLPDRRPNPRSDRRKVGARMGTALIVLTGTGIKVGAVRKRSSSSDPPPHEDRRPAVRVEAERGRDVSFFQFKEMLEARKQNRPNAKLAVVTDEIEGPPASERRFRVSREPPGSEILASFDTLDERLPIFGCRRSDWRYFIHDHRKIVWPAGLSRRLSGLP